MVVDEPTAAGDFILSEKSEKVLIKEWKYRGLIYLGFGARFVLAGASVMLTPWLGM